MLTLTLEGSWYIIHIDCYRPHLISFDLELSLLKELPHVKDASYRSGNHDTCLTGTRIDELRHIED
jgi:hypothetical protein